MMNDKSSLSIVGKLFGGPPSAAPWFFLSYHIPRQKAPRKFAESLIEKTVGRMPFRRVASAHALLLLVVLLFLFNHNF